MTEGDRFGYLTVITLIKGRKHGPPPMAECACACGATTKIRQSHLRTGKRLMCVSCTRKRAWLSRVRTSNSERMLLTKETEYKCNAKSKNRVWLLTRDEFRYLVQSDCLYCGVASSNGIDRINSDVGYTLDNCAPCCSQCNYAKRDQSVSDFIEWVKRIAEFQGVV